ncbi:MAG: methyltransferase domain-containing protein [Candidatus Peribacteraceae bacterium]|nr:methyltransferase domain-containing protein [Candidatus Peribacteraceae bacterium]
MRLHLGSGNQIFENYINIDYKPLYGVDVQADIRQLPFKDNSIELIETYHTFEHIPRQEVASTLSDWFRILKLNGILIIEMPDFNQNCRDYLDAIEREDWDGANFQLAYIFGGDTSASEDAHRWGYDLLRLAYYLYSAGFRDIINRKPQNYLSKQGACLRMECRKK